MSHSSTFLEYFFGRPSTRATGRRVNGRRPSFVDRLTIAWAIPCALACLSGGCTGDDRNQSGKTDGSGKGDGAGQADDAAGDEATDTGIVDVETQGGDDLEFEESAGDEHPTGESTAGDSESGDDASDVDVETPKFDLIVPDGIMLPTECPIVHAVSRDFKKSHPDFETFTGETALRGIVDRQLGADEKPVHARQGGTMQTSGRRFYEQWYNDVPGTNEAFEIEIELEKDADGVCVYDNPEFFPLDGRGFGSEGLTDENGVPHNYHFTTEIRTEFVYVRGQHFTFTGDDDLWMFVDGRLAIDLGGLHPPESQTVQMDDLGLSEGRKYSMHIFHAERHTTWSNFRIATNIDLVPPG